MQVSIPGTLLCLAVALLAPVEQANAGYEFQMIVEGGGPLLGTPYPDFQNPVINNSGSVAYFTGGSSGGIWLAQGGSTSRLVAIGQAYGGSTFQSFGGSVAINGGGTIAFIAWLTDGTNGVYTVDSKGAITRIADTTGEFSAFTAGRPSINNDGKVAFYAQMDDGGRAVFVGDGQTLTRIFDTKGSIAVLDNFPSINGDGVVSVNARMDDGTGVILVGDGTTTSVYAQATGAFSGFFSRPGTSINNKGEVAFAAQLTGGGTGFYVADGSNVEQYVGSSPTFALLDMSLNNRGDLLFEAYTYQGGSIIDGLFIADGKDILSILQTGSMLDGLLLTGIDITDGHSVNEQGGFAFVAARGNGRVDLWSASFRGVPEPSALTLLAVGLVGLAALRRQNH